MANSHQDLTQSNHWPFSNLLYSAYESRLLSKIDRNRLPHHIAVLADGNRRWARLNAPDMPLVVGYQAGANKLKDLVQWCDQIGIQIVTLWVLSTDNLNRSVDAEIGPLLGVIENLMISLAKDGRWRIQVVGASELLPEKYARSYKEISKATENNTGMHINMAVSYGGRHELRDAVRSLLAEEAAKGNNLSQLSKTLNIDDIAKHLYTSGQPDPDLIIRTSGEQRLSGFLMWQSAHSEFYFCDTLWPDFRKIDFLRAIRTYTQRERRFGH